jgi:uncharacterized protein YdgA (DUF945 family)
MLNLSFFMKSPKVSKTAWILSPIRPLDFKTSLSKKIVFVLANAIDTDQG